MAGLSYGERRKKKIEKAKAKEEKRAARAEKSKQQILLTEADLNDMNFEQKLWIYVRTFFIAGWPFLLYLVMPAICMAIGRIFLYTAIYKDETEAVSDAIHFYVFAGVVITLLILRSLARRKGSSIWKEAGFSFEDIKFGFLGKLYLFGFCAAGFVSSVLSLLPDKLMAAYDETAGSMFNGYDMLFSFICVIVLTPLAEETVFRGYLFKRLKPLFKRTKAIWIVSIIFALCHMSISWIIYGTVLGLCMAFIVDRHGNTFYSLAIHMGFNIFSVITYIISDIPGANDLLFGSKWIFIIYALIFAGLTFLFINTYCKKEKLWKYKEING